MLVFYIRKVYCVAISNMCSIVFKFTKLEILQLWSLYVLKIYLVYFLHLWYKLYKSI